MQSPTDLTAAGLSFAGETLREIEMDRDGATGARGLPTLALWKTAVFEFLFKNF